MPALTAHRHHLCQRSSGWRESAVHLPPTGNLTRLLGCQPSSSEFVPHLYALRTISEIAYAARGIVRVEAMGAVGAQAAERAEPERDESPLCIEMVGDGRWRRAFVQRVADLLLKGRYPSCFKVERDR